MQQLQHQKKFCEAREFITDNELYRLADRYHNRHPTFTIDIQERTCKTIILACIYHYRHIEIDLRCQCIFNDSLHKFESNWSTDNIEYKTILNEMFLHRNFLLTNRSLDDQIESIIEQITKYFTRLKPIQEEERQQQQQQQSMLMTSKDSTSLLPSIEIVKYERSPQSGRKQFFERSLSWSQPLTTQTIHDSNTIEEKI